MENEKIYFDNAATTMLGAEVLNAMMPVFNDVYGNSSSIHSFGRDASNLVDLSRDTIAETISAKSNEIYFTGSGSEANTWAIIGIVNAYKGRGNHIITSKIEHPSVINACKYLEEQGFEVTYLDVDHNGFVNFAELLRSIKPTTILASIQSANNELGTIQNLKAIAQTLHEKGVLFHTDAVQLYGNMMIDVEDIGIDAMTISSHKIYGPKGVGALYLSNKVKIDSIIFGGNQERGKRGGTTNTAGVVGFAKACEIAYRDIRTNNHKINGLHDYFITKLTDSVENIVINANVRQKLPTIVSVTFVGVDGESLLTKLDMNGIAVSTGSACSSNSLTVSPVMTAIGLTNEDARGTIRFSFGKNNSYAEIDKAIVVIKKVVDELRAFSSTYGMKTRKRKGDKNV
ncbi:MAG: cysteine desulfurase [Clostridiales bacterium]|nr:cysteine desulfurase [Clostridiales bacterium]